LKATGKPKTHTNSADRAVGSTESRVLERERHEQMFEMLLLQSRSSQGADCEYWVVCFEHPWRCVVRHFGCELSATSVTSGPTYGTTTLNITAPTAAAMLAPSDNPRFSGLYAAWLPLPFGMAVMSRLNKRPAWISAGLLPLFLLVLSSCGGNSQNQNQMKQTPQTYAVTVTGTSGANQHTIQAAVTVQ